MDKLNIDEDEYVIGEVVIGDLPIEFNGIVEVCPTIEELGKLVEKDFEGYGVQFTEPGVYRILMKVPKSFISDTEHKVNFVSLMDASLKKKAYIADKYSVEDRFMRNFEFNVTPDKKVDINFRTIDSNGKIYQTRSVTYEHTRGKERMGELKEIFWNFIQSKREQSRGDESL